MTTRLFAKSLELQELSQLELFVIQLPDHGLAGKERLQAFLVSLSQVFGVLSEGLEQSPLVLELRNKHATEAQKVMLNNADHVKGFCHDLRIREPFSNHLPIGLGKVDTDYLDLLSAFESAEKC